MKREILLFLTILFPFFVGHNAHAQQNAKEKGTIVFFAPKHVSGLFKSVIYVDGERAQDLPNEPLVLLEFGTRQTHTFFQK
jgi:hypothetical protein